MKTLKYFSVFFILSFWSINCFSQVKSSGNLKQANTNTGRAVIIGREGVAYKIGNKSFEILHESNKSSLMSNSKLALNGSININAIGGKTEVVSTKSVNLNTVATVNSQNTISVNLTGEPVPGAEIYVELEPGNEPIINNPDSVGFWEFSVTPKSGISPKSIKISIKLNSSCFNKLSQNGKEFIGKGIYIFGVQTSINTKTYLNQFAVVVNEPIYNLTNANNDMSGPFSQSLSNIEDNGKYMNSNLSRRTKVEVKVFLLNVFSDIN